MFPFLIDVHWLHWALAMVLLFGATADFPIYLLWVPLGLLPTMTIISPWNSLKVGGRYGLWDTLLVWGRYGKVTCIACTCIHPHALLDFLRTPNTTDFKLESYLGQLHYQFLVNLLTPLTILLVTDSHCYVPV